MERSLPLAGIGPGQSEGPRRRVFGATRGQYKGPAPRWVRGPDPKGEPGGLGSRDKR